MREHGHTYQEIGEKYGVSRQCVHRKMKDYERALKGIRGQKFDINRIVFKGMYDYFADHYAETMNSFSHKIYGYEDGPNLIKLRNFITGKQNTRFSIGQIKLMCAITGKTFEELFKERG